MCLVVLKCYSSKGHQEATKKIERTRHNNGSSPAGQFLLLEYRTIRALWILERTLSVTETLVSSATHGRVGTGMQGKGKENQGKKDDNEVSSMSPNENVELYSDEGSFAEEDRIGAEQKKKCQNR